jgi:hypothetical protein
MRQPSSFPARLPSTRATGPRTFSWYVCFLFFSCFCADALGFEAILKQYRFDMPAGLENIPADWEKVVEAVQDALTQRRSKIKKSVSYT